jgi:hypothetical protein
MQCRLINDGRARKSIYNIHGEGGNQMKIERKVNRLEQGSKDYLPITFFVVIKSSTFLCEIG